jgi:hypothetical protein
VWVYGFYIRTKAFEYIHCYDREEFSDSVFTCHAIIPETVGQYSELEDSKGRRIFEGDIVRIDYDVPDDKYKLGVVYCRFGVFEILRRGDFEPENLYNAVEEEGVEIIGNIDEDPETLMCCLKTLKELNAGSGKQNHDTPEILKEPPEEG